MGYKVSLSRGKNPKLFVKRTVTNGRVQMAFKAQYGDKSGACVLQQAQANSNRIGSLTQAEVRGWVSGCRGQKGQLPGNFIHGTGEDARVARARRRSKVLAGRST